MRQYLLFISNMRIKGNVLCRKNVTSHRMTSHGENNACNCEECGSHFSNKNSLRVHMQKYHLTPAVKVTCEICGRQVKSMQNLKIHMQNHDKNRTR